MKIFYFIKTFFWAFKRLRKDKKIFESFDYYKDINEIPLWNWWKCKEGDLGYIWKVKQVYIPGFFKQVFAEMFFQLDWIDNDELRKTAQANYYQNLWLTTKDIKYKRKADTKFAELKELQDQKQKQTTLNDLLKLVQTGLKLSFQIDAQKISAGYFFSLLTEVRNNGINREEGHN